MDYTPLQVISAYSLLQSTISINALVDAAIKRGYQSIALTDKNVMYGSVEFYDACKRAGIHPIIGLTLKCSGLINHNLQYDLLLLAQNQTGYHNLIRISTRKQTLKDNQILKWDDIKKLLSGIYVISTTNGELNSFLESGQTDLAYQYVNLIKSDQDANSFKIGINLQHNDIYIDKIKKLAKKTKTKLVALAPVYYLEPEDLFALNVLKAVENDKRISNPIRASKELGKDWLMPNQMMVKTFQKKNLSAALAETNAISSSCNVKIEKRPTELPRFKTPDQIPSSHYLQSLCEKGLKKRASARQIDINRLKDYRKRLHYELSVIHDMGFDDYFLIVWDIMDYIHTQNITTGAGRGSAAGSLVSYTLYITDVDPLRYHLLFERFLNKERAQMPDIDLDIPDDRRDDVLKYVHDKYGHERVSQIITFGTMATKQSLRDVGRTFSLDSDQLSHFSRAIPKVLNISLSDSFKQSQALRNIVHDNKLNQLIFKTALKLEGLPRHYSTHAAGLILSDHPLVDVVPLQNGNDNMYITQYSKNYTEEIGLLKIDFLGLRNLSIMGNILKIIHQNTGKWVPIHRVNLNDPKTLNLFQQGDTNGVFQFESEGIKTVLRRLHPDNFNLIAAVDALYRPGPMHNIPSFIKRKKHLEKVTYPDQSLKSILGSTYGIIVYQEQVMLVASSMGGFTLGQADILRRAMSKKKRAVMDSMGQKFMKGAQKLGFSNAVAKQTFDYIDRFASYGFNKSHAFAYSKFAFELAYLKAHYSRAFITSVLNASLNNARKIKIYLMEAKKRDIKIISPDVNLSGDMFTLKNHQIIFGLKFIHGLRNDFVRFIIKDRHDHGQYKNLEQFIRRLPDHFRTNDLMKPLIFSGALDCFGYNRAELIHSIDSFIETINLSGHSINLFKELKPKIKHIPDLPLKEKLQRENQFLGFYLSGHPVERFKRVASVYHALTTDELPSASGNLNTILYLNELKTIRTKKGDLMAFATGSDEIGNVHLTIFPTTYKNIQGWLKKGIVIFVRGQVDQSRGFQIICNQVAPADNVAHMLNQRLKINQRCYLKIDVHHDQSMIINQLYQIISHYRGKHSIIIYREKDDSKFLLENPYKIQMNSKVNLQLKNLLGKQNVIFQ
ncbi:DNA-directed DNA polymerase [Philodulcilactobacillus myokoensis]|uniref:DNA-directed DNA polymerase n=1 Tax=Philodulcilactobacillus myokoensis TaxID=2929573 RepID=A0A9W6ETB2_9LACO|nr:DNA polymerase III subunit alpha [Philodulcilactobacillus myokoensis]GLB46899.1 DNA-directed DNA polymerase [Philodulcilactobacillus myokoensis]